jgi:hypothetical protein
MTLHARQAKITSIQALCLAALGFIATPAAAQSSGADMYTLDQGRPAPEPIGAPTEPAPPAPLPFAEAAPEPSAPPPPRDPRGAAARWQIGGSLSGSVYTIHSGASSNPDQDQHGNRGSIYLGPTVFLTPVIDNDAPHSLQPFLQRTSTVYANVSGGGFVTRYGNGAFTRTDSYVGASAGVDAYLTRNFALNGGIGYTYDVLHDNVIVNKGHSFSGSAGFGVRVVDVRFDASYSFNAYDLDGSFVKLRWGSVGLGAYAVFAQSFTLQLSGRVADDGGGGGVDLGFYTTKDLGVFTSFSGQTFAYSGTDTRANRYTGSLGFSYWVTPGLRFNWTYSLRLTHTPEQPLRSLEHDELEHALSLNVLARLP